MILELDFRFLDSRFHAYPFRFMSGITTSASCGDCVAGKYSSGTGELLLRLGLGSRSQWHECGVTIGESLGFKYRFEVNKVLPLHYSALPSAPSNPSSTHLPDPIVPAVA
jgi:hypothetical protein